VVKEDEIEMIKTEREFINGCDTYIYNAKKGVDATIIMVPGGSGGNGQKYFSGLAKYFTRFNFCVIAFDCCGQGKSETKKGYSIKNAVMDLRGIVNFTRDNFMFNGRRGIGIWAKCGGGVIATQMMVANPPSSVKSLSVWGVPYNFKQYFRTPSLNPQIDRLKKNGVRVDISSYAISYNLEDLIPRVKIPMLIAGGLMDENWNIKRQHQILGKVNKQFYSKLVVFPHLGHSVDDTCCGFLEYAQTFVDWFKRACLLNST
jgi:pimeloyl-ACP methyl ester carboxylesterase